MTASIRILTTSTLDSSPSLFLVSPNGSKTLVNCGEGCQRSFLESPGLRVRSVNRVCLTHISHNAVGGLPGMVLTTADVAEAAMMSAASKNNNNNAPNNTAAAKSDVANGATARSKRKASSPIQNVNANDKMPGLDICGPRGTHHFLHSLRHFMRRDRFQLKVHEGAYRQASEPQSTPRTKGKRGRKNQDENDAEGFFVESIPCTHNLTEHNKQASNRASGDKGNDSSSDAVQVVSFVFTTPPIPGKFLAEKARELGIPSGPLYGKLKSGKTVTFVHPTTNEETTIESCQVVAKGSPGVAVAVIYCPSLQVLQQLQKSPVLIKLGIGGNEKEPELEVMIHMAPTAILESSEYRAWMRSFPTAVSHILMECPNYLAEQTSMFENDRDGSPFHSAALGAMTRSLLHDTLFPSPVPPNDHLRIHEGTDNTQPAGMNATGAGSSSNGADDTDPDPQFAITRARPMMEYVIIPRLKRGFSEITRPTMTYGISNQERAEVDRVAKESGALDLARKLHGSNGGTCDSTDSVGELLFTGTGSAIPCKHRNVTGMYLRMRNGNAMLLDVGEGTTGQLLLSKQSQNKDVSYVQELIRNIKAVWVSHPHADHHLGLLRFLTERNAICGQGVDPVVLMAPPNLFRFLDEYSSVDPRIKGSYIQLDCRDMVPERRNPLGDKLYHDLGITYCVSIPVAHCPHSYAVVVDGTAFGRVAYSGDCRPSNRFADVAFNADLLIHEATFEDGMEQEAVMKRHCTVGEALGVGRRMKAKAVVLTHFSQRYPRIPPLKTNDSTETNGESNGGTADDKALHQHDNSSTPIVFAFDFMSLSPGNVAIASKLTPALRLLYPEDGNAEEDLSAIEGAMDADDPLEPPASKVLSIPGIFAQNDIL